MPHSVYAHGPAQESPWFWALIHGAFILAASAANVVSWRATEQLLRDPLTGLAGRAIMFDRLRVGLLRAHRRGSHAGVIFLDLDRFKVLNDSLGHAAGDRVLVTAGERLRDAVRAHDTAVRFGGDEFVIVCEDLHDVDEAVGVAGRLVAALREPYLVDGQEIVLTVSAGIAVGGAGDDRSAEELIRDADAAMYRAKENGKDRYVVFGEDMRARALTRLADEVELRSAIARDELRVHYEPQFALGSGRLRAVEAHVNWQHPTRGLLVPRDFRPIAEETGMVVPIGAWAIDEACAQLRRWRHAGAATDVSVSINVSALQLSDAGLFPPSSMRWRQPARAPALCLEIPEAAVVADPARARDDRPAARRRRARRARRLRHRPSLDELPASDGLRHAQAQPRLRPRPRAARRRRDPARDHRHGPRAQQRRHRQGRRARLAAARPARARLRRRAGPAAGGPPPCDRDRPPRRLAAARRDGSGEPRAAAAQAAVTA